MTIHSSGRAKTRFSGAKKSFATRRVPMQHMGTVVTTGTVPKAGDLVLARVDELGQHQFIELETGRRARLFPGDEVILAYGNRYAPDQYEAFVPKNLEPCHMVAAGGIAATSVCQHNKMRGATEITPVGLIGDGDGKVLNLSLYGMKGIPAPSTSNPYVLAVVGTSMNSGKTETATQLIRGFTNAGLKVGAAKVTGTGSGGDIWSMLDAGAFPVLDFTDFGLSTTYLAPPEQVQDTMSTLIAHLKAAHVDVIVFEVADGVYQQETAALLSSPAFAQTVNGVVFAAADSLGAAAGVKWLRGRSLPVLGVTGVLTSSPLAMREATSATELPIFRTDSLSTAHPSNIFGLTITKQEMPFSEAA